MNKTIFTIMRALNWVYVIALLVYFIFLIYSLEFKPVPVPVSMIPALSVSSLTGISDKLKTRVFAEGAPQYSSPSATAYGKTEPFNQ